jgi:hypothetical protein
VQGEVHLIVCLTAADAWPNALRPCSLRAAPVAWCRTLEPNLAVNVVTQVRLGLCSPISQRQVVVEQLDVLAWRLGTAVQRGDGVTPYSSTGITPMHFADLELGRVTAARHAIVRSALRYGPRLFHVVHLEVTERDVSGVAEATTYSVSAVLLNLGYLGT